MSDPIRCTTFSAIRSHAGHGFVGTCTAILHFSVHWRALCSQCPIIGIISIQPDNLPHPGFRKDPTSCHVSFPVRIKNHNNRFPLSGSRWGFLVMNFPFNCIFFSPFLSVSYHVRTYVHQFLLSADKHFPCFAKRKTVPFGTRFCSYFLTPGPVALSPAQFRNYPQFSKLLPQCHLHRLRVRPAPFRRSASFPSATK